MITSLELVWPDQYIAVVELEDNPVSRYIVSCVKHLQQLPLEFNHRDNPLVEVTDHTDIVLSAARQIGIELDADRLFDQHYLNMLHDRYLDAYGSDKDPNWLPFHDALHAMEDLVHRDRTSIWVDYKHRAGPLIRPFDRDLLRYHTPHVRRGDCCVLPHELGKTLWYYYRDREANDMSRICAIAKPWQYLKPVLDIFYLPEQDRNRPYHTDREFRGWVDDVVPVWTKHHGIQDWSPEEINTRLRVGHLPDIGEVQSRFGRNDCPTRLRLKQ